MSTSLLIWSIIGAIYFIVVSVLVFVYFGTKAPKRQREFWTILITWIISLLFGPFFAIAAGVVVIRKIFMK